MATRPFWVFVGSGLDVKGSSFLHEGEPITMDLLALYSEKIEKADFLLFHLGWDKRWGTEAYFGDYPCIDQAVLEHILNGCYKGIGFDVIGGTMRIRSFLVQLFSTKNRCM